MTDQAPHLPSQHDVAELRTTVRHLMEHLEVAADAVHEAFLAWEEVNDRFQRLLKNPEVAGALQALREADVSPRLQNPRPEVTALQTLCCRLGQIGSDLIPGYKYGDETKNAADVVLVALDLIPAIPGSDPPAEPACAEIDPRARAEALRARFGPRPGGTRH